MADVPRKIDKRCCDSYRLDTNGVLPSHAEFTLAVENVYWLVF